MKKGSFQVSIVYPLSVYLETDHTSIEEKWEGIAKKYGGRKNGSGAGFGKRDIGYYGFKDKKKADAFASRMKRFKVVSSVEVSLDNY